MSSLNGYNYLMLSFYSRCILRTYPLTGHSFLIIYKRNKYIFWSVFTSWICTYIFQFELWVREYQRFFLRWYWDIKTLQKCTYIWFWINFNHRVITQFKWVSMIRKLFYHHIHISYTKSLMWAINLLIILVVYMCYLL